MKANAPLIISNSGFSRPQNSNGANGEPGVLAQKHAAVTGSKCVVEVVKKLSTHIVWGVPWRCRHAPMYLVQVMNLSECI